MSLTYFLNDIEIVPVAPIITGITFVFTFQMRCIYYYYYYYFQETRTFLYFSAISYRTIFYTQTDNIIN